MVEIVRLRALIFRSRGLKREFPTETSGSVAGMIGSLKDCLQKV